MLLYVDNLPYHIPDSSISDTVHMSFSTLRVKKTAQEQIHALERTIKELEKDHATEKRELQSEAEQKLSAAQKDAALETLNAVAAKEREMNGQLLQLERENAKLQAKIELLEARLQQQP